MVKLQKIERDESNREIQIKMTVPISTAKLLGWVDKLKDGEEIEVDASATPERDGFIAREV